MPTKVVWLIALAHFLLHALTNGNYGIFRDELYYLDCARHPAWGYVDHPPLSIWLLAATRAVFGESIHAIRLLSELAGAALVVVAALLAKELGGGRFAQIVAALATGFAPALMVETGFYSMNAFDLLFWAVLAWMVVRIAKGADPRWWLCFGVVAGLGLLNKISVLFLGFAVIVAILLTNLRRQFGRWELYVGGLISALFFLPYILWNAARDWPTREFMENAKRFKIVALAPADFLGEQIMGMNPLLAPLWIGGLIWLLVPGRGARYRVLGIIYVTVLVFLMVQHAKAYYVFPAYAMLFAAGGCALESLFQRWRSKWPRGIVLTWIVVVGAATIPLSVPLLSPENFVRYQAALGIKQKPAETSGDAEMPQYFADRFGWENMTAVVASVYNALPDGEKKPQCLIIGSNYGEIGAINYFGSRHGLPSAFGVHNNHFYWEPPTFEPSVVLHIGGSREFLERLFNDVRLGATIHSRYAMSYETNLPVFVCRGPKTPLREVWRAAKKFI